jgi:hypothetical protein
MTLSGLELATFRLITQRLNQLRYRLLHVSNDGEVISSWRTLQDALEFRRRIFVIALLRATPVSLSLSFMSRFEYKFRLTNKYRHLITLKCNKTVHDHAALRTDASVILIRKRIFMLITRNANKYISNYLKLIPLSQSSFAERAV